MKNIVVVGLVLLALAGIVSGESEEAHVILRVSRDFQQPLLLEKRAHFSGQSVMKLLKENANVATAYGGAFVVGINDLTSGKGDGTGRAWFYYVNGMLGSVGALRYIPKNGDIIHWDLHSWENSTFVPALIGAYPQPFTGLLARSESVDIMYSPGMEKEARKLAGSLSRAGSGSTHLEPLPEKKTEGNNAKIFLGPWNTLCSNNVINELYRNGKKCGLLFDCDKERLYILDLRRGRRSSCKRGGVIVALARGFSPATPIWLISGTDRMCTQRAAELLIEEPARIKGLAGAVIVKDKIYSLPYSKVSQ
jgi:hypothetical protein